MTPRAAVESGPPSDAMPRERPGALRRCAATRRLARRETLVRFVIDPAGDVIPDPEGSLPGRGLWLSADRDVVNTACVRNLFAKNFRSSVIAPSDMSQRVEALLARRCLDFLGLARRCGQLVAGTEKVRGLLNSGAAALWVAAVDAADGGCSRIGRVAPEVPCVRLFTGTELAAAIGRDRAVYAAVRPGRLAERIAVEAGRLAGFRRQPHASGPLRAGSIMVGTK